jgi:hypothetical protein
MQQIMHTQAQVVKNWFDTLEDAIELMKVGFEFHADSGT